ncbi:MAG: hypothetical protein WAL67_05740 [Candidatus Cybelea sp.]
MRDVPSFETTECLRLNMDGYEYDLLSEFGKDVVTVRNNACCSLTERSGGMPGEQGLNEAPP